MYLGPSICQPLRKVAGGHGPRLGTVASGAPVAQLSSEIDIGQQVDFHSVPRLPVRRRLQDRRTADAAVREQQLFSKLASAGAGGDGRRDSLQSAISRRGPRG